MTYNGAEIGLRDAEIGCNASEIASRDAGKPTRLAKIRFMNKLRDIELRALPLGAGLRLRALFSRIAQRFGLARSRCGGYNGLVVTPAKASPPAKPRNRRPNDACFPLIMTSNSR